MQYGEIGCVIDKLHEIDPINNNELSVMDDISVAKIFAEIIEPYCRYNVTSKNWYIYNGCIWEKDVSDVAINNIGMLVQRGLLVYLSDCLPDKLNDEQKAFQKQVLRLSDRGNRWTMIKDAASFIYCSNDDLDHDSNILNLKNGTMDLQTGELREHTANDMLTLCADADYLPDARSETWLNFLDEIMEGDKEKISYLQRIAGYSLLGNACEEQCYFCYGPSSRNGKSTFISTLKSVYGSYSASMAPEVLAERNKNSSSPTPELARLRGVRFVDCVEIPRRMLLDSSLLKSITGRDAISCRFLGENLFEFIPRFVLWFNTNYLPVCSDRSVFQSDRIRVIEFPHHFERSEQDSHLKTKLASDEIRTAVLNWMLEGLEKYREIGLQEPEAVMISTIDYQNSMDKIQNFFDECMKKDADCSITAKEAYKYYKRWCEKNSFGIDSKGNFLDELRTRRMLSETGTINGKTCRNVVRGWDATEETMREYCY